MTRKEEYLPDAEFEKVCVWVGGVCVGGWGAPRLALAQRLPGRPASPRQVFGKNRAAFNAQPAWRRQLQKKDVSLW